MNKKTLLYIIVMTFIIIFVPIQAFASTNEIQVISNDSIILPQSADTSFSWKLAANAANSKNVYLNKDETILVSALLSSSSYRARIGIIDLDNTYNVKSILGSGSYSFTAPSSGTYKIYCKNTDSATFTVVINYSIN